MKKLWKMVGKGFLVLVAGTMIGTILLTLAYVLPINTQNRDSIYETLWLEGKHTRAVVSGLRYDRPFEAFLLPDVMDNYTDDIMIRTTLREGEGNPLVWAMEAYSEKIGSYAYYWHGYVSVLRPLFLFFDYTEFRFLNCVLQLLLVFVLAYLIGREKGIRYVLLLLTSYLLLMPVALFLSLQFIWIFYVSYIATLVLLWKRDFFAAKTRYVFLFMAIGMAACYFDLLTYPLYTWGMPLMWWMIVDKEEREEAAWVKQVIISGIGWIAGYGGIWVMKWALGTVILGRNIFESAADKVFLWSSLQGHESMESRLQAIYINWKHYGYKIYAFILAAWLVWWLYRSLTQGEWRRDSKRYAYFLVGVSSVAWYFVLPGHTSGHNYFTYRIFGVSVLAFLAIVSGSIEEIKAGKVELKKRLILCVALLVVAILSLPLMRLAREELSVMNGVEQFRRVQVERYGFLEVSFSPTFNEIHNFSLGLESVGREGYCQLTLWQGEEQKYQEIYSLENFSEGNYQVLDVNWRLNHRKTYRLTLEMIDTNEPVYVWVTENGAMPLIEYGELSLNGSTEEGQLLTGITYWCMPTSREFRLFLTLIWMGILLAVVCVLWPDLKNIVDRKITGYEC